MPLVAAVRRFLLGRIVRQWMLAAPMLILAISVPLIQRPSDPSRISDDELANLATVQAIVEQHLLAIDRTDFRGTRSRIGRNGAAGDASGGHLYSNQPPMLAFLASGPYWVLHNLGVTFANRPRLTIFLLTLFTVTLPVALSADWFTAWAGFSS